MNEGLKFSIGVDLSDLDKGLERASAGIKSFAERNKANFEKVGASMVDVGAKMSIVSAGIIAGIGAMGLLAKNVGNVADRLLDLQDITGASTDAIQEWQYVARIAGVDAETFTRATEGLVRRLKDVGEEGSPAVKILRDLGIQTNDSSGAIRNSGTIVDETIKKLASMENVTQRNAIASQLFGLAWKDVAPLLSVGAEGIEALQKEAHDLGLVMSETALNDADNFRKATEKVTVKIEALKNSIGAKLAPVIEKTLIPLITNYIIPMFERVASAVASVVNWFNDLNPVVKTIIAVITGLLVAIGPLLVAIGGFIQLLPVLIAGFGALITPVGLIVAGIVALTVAILANWDTIKQWAEDVVNYFIRLYNKSIIFRAGVEGLILVFKNLWEVVKFVALSIYNIVTTVFKNIWEAIKLVGDLIVSVLTLDLEGIKKGLNKAVKSVQGNVSTLFDNISNDAKALFNNISKNGSDALQNALNGSMKEVDFSVSAESTKKLTEAVSDAVSTGVQNGMSGNAKVSAVGPNVSSLGLEAIPSIAPAMEVGWLQPMAKTLTEMEIRLFEFAESVNELAQNTLYNAFSGIGEAIGSALASGQNVLQAIGKSLLSTIGGFLSQFGDKLIAFALASSAFAKLQLALSNPATAIASAGVALVAGIALKALGGAVASFGSGGGGGGGGYSSGGASQSYSNSGSGSFTSFASQNTNEVVFRISGSDLLGVLRRAEGNELRLG